uniref:Uncharacterized protein n=1 Tax=uncultured organism TaxID=155900 RepID=M1P201_9ZZZZ|nr:hypothetical protein FLSS-25_0022 [uncultured organism]
MNIILEVDDEKVVMNKFVREMLSAVISCAVSNLQVEKADPEKKKKIGEDWEKVNLEITKD